MPASSSQNPVPSDSDDEIDNLSLPSGRVWAYPCKYPLCPDYGKSWLLRSNFLCHLLQQEAHAGIASTPAARRAIEIEWRYTTNPDLPRQKAPDFLSREDPDEQEWTYSFRNNAGVMISRRRTKKQMEADIASQHPSRRTEGQ
jgi:hypothetical protein